MQTHGDSWLKGRYRVDHVQPNDNDGSWHGVQRTMKGFSQGLSKVFRRTCWGLNHAAAKGGSEADTERVMAAGMEGHPLREGVARVWFTCWGRSHAAARGG